MLEEKVVIYIPDEGERQLLNRIIKIFNIDDPNKLNTINLDEYCRYLQKTDKLPNLIATLVKNGFTKSVVIGGDTIKIKDSSRLKTIGRIREAIREAITDAKETKNSCSKPSQEKSPIQSEPSRE